LGTSFEGPELHRLVICAIFAALVGCSEFPALDAAVSDRARNADYPEIVPLHDLVASVPPVPTGLGVGNLTYRLQNLRVRAAYARSRPVVDAETRRRMQAALNRHWY